MTWDGFNVACLGITPKRMGATFAFKVASIFSEMLSAMPCVSFNGHHFFRGFGWKASESILTAIFRDQLNSFGETLETFLLRSSLTISAGKFRAIGYEPFAILFDDGIKFVVYGRPPDNLS